MSELNYHSTKFFTKNLLAIEMKKTEIFVNRPVYLGLSILELKSFILYLKQKTFTQTLQKMWKKDLILQTMN